MYYDEKIIDNILHFRLSPADIWRPHTQQSLTARITKQSERIKSLEDAGRNVLEASNQYSFFLDGYANGSASIAECRHWADEVHKAQTVLFELLKQK